MELVSYIYKVTNLVNGKSYIGQSIDPITRLSKHIKSNSNLLNEAIKKYGVENFLFEVIKSDVPIEQINEAEIQCIREHNCKVPNGYNLTEGGEGSLGCIPSEETRRKIGLIHKGKVVSEKTREKISAAQTGRIVSQETGNKISKANTGKKASREHKEKISKALSGKSKSDEHRQKLILSLSIARKHKKSLKESHNR